MRNEELPSIEQIVQFTAEVYNQEFTKEEAFADAFLHGEFHEESPDWTQVGSRLSNRELISLYLPVCRIMLGASIENREGENLLILMNCYSALLKWEKSALKEISEVVEPLAAARSLLLKEAKDNRSTWWFECVRHFQVLEYGIYRRMGVHPIAISKEYFLIDYGWDEM